jgi:hypothetical protein
MEQQGEGLEEWSDAAGKDNAAAGCGAVEAAAGYEAAEVDDMAGEYEAAEVDDMAGDDVSAVWEPGEDTGAGVGVGVSAVGWEPGEDTDAAKDLGAVWETQEDAETVAWDEGEGGALDRNGPGGRRPATGEPRVGAALARLDELTSRPVTEHRAIFEDVHRRLRDVLGELDTREQGSGDQPAAAGAERRAAR